MENFIKLSWMRAKIKFLGKYLLSQKNFEIKKISSK